MEIRHRIQGKARCDAKEVMDLWEKLHVMSLERKYGRSSFAGAAFFAALGFFEAVFARHAQINHAILNYKGSRFTPGVGLLCFILFLRQGGLSSRLGIPKIG